MSVIGNDPFDPHAAAKALKRGPARGRRFRNLLYAGFGLGVAGMVAVQMGLLGGRDREKRAGLDIQPANAAVPAANTPAAQEPQTPQQAKQEPAAGRRSEPARRGGQPKGPKLPTAVAFAVNAPEPPPSFMADGTTLDEGLGCTLRPAANNIFASLTTVIQSEIGGQAQAVVTEDVFDADGYGQLLIPRGSHVQGLYKHTGQRAFNDRRLPFIWQTITMPPGHSPRQIRLPDADGLDAAGSMGMTGVVETHWGELIAAAALFTFFDVGQRAAVPNDAGVADRLQNSASRQFGQLGFDYSRQLFNLEPDIMIPAGTQLVISPRQPVKVSNNCG